MLLWMLLLLQFDSIAKMAAAEEDVVNLVVKWSGKEYSFENIQKSKTVADLKQMICDKTMVLPGRQKLLGLKYKGKEKLQLLPSSRTF